MFYNMPVGKLVIGSKPGTVMALICADDLGAAVGVAEPDRIHEPEIELAGDALTYPEMAEVLSRVTGGKIVASFISLQERAQRAGASAAFGDVVDEQIGCPARPGIAATIRNVRTSMVASLADSVLQRRCEVENFRESLAMLGRDGNVDVDADGHGERRRTRAGSISAE